MGAPGSLRPKPLCAPPLPRIPVTPSVSLCCFIGQRPPFLHLLSHPHPHPTHTVPTPTQLYFNVPFASVAAFFAVYLLLVNNPSYSRFVRFNAQQAILLDVVLILPSLLENLFRAPSGGLGLSVYISAYNTIWLFILCSFVYAVSSCALGKKARARERERERIGERGTREK